MTYDPRTEVTTERNREVIVTPSGPNNGGIALAAVLVVLAISFVVWLSLRSPSNSGEGNPESKGGH